ncbi:hypothetical protein FQR65_LT00485 [Abscondita terminalis]|nr:hypothetical protein FQR65_LT00485 [Abscondita terminalis]
MFLILFVTSILLNTSSSAKFPLEIKKVWNSLTIKYQDECLYLSKTNPDYPRLMVENGYVPNDLSFGCYLRCIYEKTGALKPDGQFDITIILRKVSYMSENLSVRCIREAENEDDFCKKSLIAGNCTVMAIIE